MTDSLVSAEWLLANHENVRIFDVSNHLPTANRRANDEFEEAHRPGAGHIPGSRNLPFSELFDDDGQYRDEEAIRSLFDAAGIDTGAPVTTTCGSGVTACALAVGLALIGNERTIVYDGSWTEWGGSDAPIKTGGAD